MSILDVVLSTDLVVVFVVVVVVVVVFVILWRVSVLLELRKLRNPERK